MISKSGIHRKQTRQHRQTADLQFAPKRGYSISVMTTALFFFTGNSRKHYSKIFKFWTKRSGSKKLLVSTADAKIRPPKDANNPTKGHLNAEIVSVQPFTQLTVCISLVAPPHLHHQNHEKHQTIEQWVLLPGQNSQVSSPFEQMMVIVRKGDCIRL